MSESYTFYAATLGCKINQYETQALREVWIARGFLESDSAAGADFILVNSCAVTAKAVSDVRSTVRQLHRANENAQIVVTGCAAQVMGDELKVLPGVVRIVPQDAKTSLKTWPELKEGMTEPENVFPDFAVTKYNRARAVVKVQDGCSHRCTYCIVPLTRGRSRSRSIADIVTEARTLLESGFRELILSGVNLRQFGRDLDGTPDFWDLIDELESALGKKWGGKARFRISSLEPGQLGEKALNVLARSTMVAPQLHISLQSGSDSVLKRMGRGHYKTAPLLDFLEKLHAIWPVYGLGADILMGFPGETEEEFAETMAFIEAMPITYAHVFPYSIRPGTAAATMSNQLPKQIKKERAKAVRDVIAAKKKTFLQQLIDEKIPLDVVVQSTDEKKGVSQFYTECYFETLPFGCGLREIATGTAVAFEKSGLRVVAE
ncbi:tRNA (N(6)-L-threonylcarbamoyladenosine(37)-C(2))-methylthiotransferase MtaB [Halodesulfovibrio sp.]|jgi:MiaB-like tRNA modifying enzyme|uniref:tRNA (N(6)-L-threonylcarbamoyladenosine(37)-C(2))- methylthiotransferase MtaB n=1 Tax=Halodesulfovibrio sp. TaxID=1912772 RepID=UPI0025D133AF|nr:tRNA (N(6)-L-threonylcarbamoyladenosine(37)-C(2))-methylthiotransferase MtaB [Halodesulfovibrio sp.]MCT4626004.1 tRNA (N(6)-L-threonylcarbamoyladenosine(37)-C(2))-methylthiotransferase MtaB [Halodesulfovibrio sp.]